MQPRPLAKRRIDRCDCLPQLLPANLWRPRFHIWCKFAAKEDRLEAVTKDKLMQDLKAVAQDVEELLKATANQTGEKIAAARARAEESLRGAQKHLFEASDEAAAHARAAADAADVYVRDNPWQAVAIAAGVAFVIGLLVGRR